MTECRRKGYWIIGRGRGPIAFLEFLRARNAEVSAVISDDPTLTAFARSAKLRHYDDLRRAIDNSPAVLPDLLVSIGTGRILTHETLRVVGRAVNGHYGLLPRYAGVHTPAWAILGGEREFGITWHCMSDVVDGGPILLQRRFDVSPAETTESLTVKCRNALEASFDDLWRLIQCNPDGGIEQSSAARTYFSERDKAPLAGVLRWSASAEELDRLTRALCFAGGQPNAMGQARTLAAGRAYVVRSLTVLGHSSGHAPGTIAAVEDGRIMVCTGTTDVAINELMTQDNRSVHVGAPPFDVGSRFTELDPTLARELKALESRDHRFQRRWAAALSQALSAELPTRYSEGSDASGEWAMLDPIVRRSLRERLPSAAAFGPESLAIIIAWADYLLQASPDTALTLPLATFESRAASRAFGDLVVPFLPLRITSRQSQRLEERCERLLQELQTISRRAPPSRDLLMRWRASALPELDGGVVLQSNQDDSSTWFSGSCRYWLALHAEEGAFRICAGAGGDATRARIATGHLAANLGVLAGQHLPKPGGSICVGAERHVTARDHVDLWGSVARRAAASPRTTAVAHGAIEVDYGELAARTKLIAARLRSLGAGCGAYVAVVGKRSPDLVLAFLAIVRAGACYIPIDPDWPESRIDHVLQQARPHVLITDGNVAWSKAAEIVTSLEELGRAGPLSNDDEPPTAVSASSPMYVLHTSGTSGAPKGVLVTYGAFANRLHWSIATAPLSNRDSVLSSAAATFDIALWEVLYPLSCGAKLVLSDHEQQGVAQHFQHLLRTHRVSVAHFVPSLLRELCSRSSSERPSSLRAIWAGGEVLEPDLVAVVQQQWGVDIHHLYGPTEATISVTHWRCPEQGSFTRVPLGEAIQGCAIYVLGRSALPVPKCSLGELYVGGVAVALGYLGDPRLTAERFLPDPFGMPGARMYRTGDFGYVDEHDRLIFSGRRDDQYKIRGQRIQASALEAVIESHPEVTKAVVRPRRLSNADTTTVLCAWFGTHVTPAPTAAALRAHAESVLPASVVPELWVHVERWPVTAHGKIDVHRLPDPERTVGRGGAPRGAREAHIANLCCQLLALDDIGRDDNLVALGAHSLLLSRLHERLASELGLTIPLRELFEASTVASIAASASCGAAPGARARGRHDAAPASPTQQRLYYEQLLEPSSIAHNVGLQVTWRGAMNCDAMLEAISGVVSDFEVLRSRFEVRDTTLWLLAERAVPLPVVTTTATETELPTRARDFVRVPFDLSRAPLWRAMLIRVACDHHVLLLALHHAICDRASMELFFERLMSRYESVVEQREVPPWRGPSYIELSIAQHSDAIDAGALAQIVEALRGADPRPLLGTADTAGATSSRASSEVRLRLDGDQARALTDLATLYGTTHFVVLMSLWHVLLKAYASTSDVTAGTLVSGRHASGSHRCFGPFVGLSAVRSLCDLNASFADLLREVQRGVMLTLETQHVPFERLVVELGLSSPGRACPLLNSVVVLEDRWLGTCSPTGVQGVVEYLSVGDSPFPLTVMIRIDGNEDMTLVLEGIASQYDSAHLRQLGTQLMTVLAGLKRNPTSQLDGLCAVIRQQRMQFSRDDAHRALHAGFWDQVRSRPDALALTHGDQHLTYGELGARVGTATRRLQQLGVQAESIVALALPRSFKWVIAMLAVLDAGGAFCCLDVNAPPEHVRNQLTNLGPLAVIGTSDQMGQLGQLGVAIEQLLDSGGDTAGPSSLAGRTEAAGSVHPEQLAYVVLTSGSTGAPKAVGISHRAAENHHRDFANRFELGPSDVVLQTCALPFDACLEEVFPALVSGSRVVLRPATLSGFDEFAALCAREQITLIDLPTAYWRTLVDTTPAGSDWPRCVRICVIGGEEADARTLQRWFVGGRRPVLFNSYGPAEATIISTIGELREPAPRASIGTPIANARIRLCDERLHPVRDGAPGELCIAGLGLARGYLGNPRATAERFVPHPDGRDGERLYRTGDLGQVDSEAGLVFIGRKDDQVKVRGARVQLGEVAAVLALQPDVSACRVVSSAGSDGSTRLHAFIQPTGHAREALVDRLRSYSERELPSEMRASTYTLVDRFPLTPTGKIDTRALLALLCPQGVEADPNLAPSTPNAVVASAFAEVLSLPVVTGSTNFFSAGGHSLLAIKLLWLIRQRLGVDLALGQLLANPTVDGVCRSLSSRQTPSLPAAVDEPSEGWELTPIQKVIRGHEKLLRPGAYNVPVALWLTGDVDSSRLQSAWDSVTRRHPALRVEFVAGADGVTRQTPTARSTVIVDHSAPANSVPSLAATERLVMELAGRPFDLDRGPFVRMHLSRVSDQMSCLLLVAHHLIVDGPSLTTLLNELSMALDGVLDETNAPFFAPGLPTPVDGAAVAHFESLLRGLTPLRLPSAKTGATQFYASRKVGRSSVAALRSFAVKAAMTPFNVTCAIVASVFARFSGGGQFAMGVPVTTRSGATLEGIVGPLMWTLPLRVTPNPGVGFRALAASLRDQFIHSLQYRGVDLTPLARASERAGLHERHPWLSLMFDFADGPQHPERLGEWPAAGVDGLARAKFDLEVGFRLDHDGGHFEVRYEGAPDQDELGEALCGALVDTLQYALAHPEAPLGDIPLGPAITATAPLAESPTLVDTLLASMASHGARTAIYADERSWTYAELGRHVQQIACRLAALGIEREDAVAVHLPRSPEWIASLIAIWQVGATYVPLDPRQPLLRLQRIADEVSPSVIIASRSSEGLQTAHARKLLVEDAFEATSDGASRPLPLVAGQAACVLFTSGSTGRPKGVVLTHRGLETRLLQNDVAPFRAADCVLQVAAMGFDISLWEVCAPLAAGAALVIANDRTVQDPALLLKVIADHKVTVLHCVPTLLKALLSQSNAQALLGLRLLMCGGERLDPALAQHWLQHHAASLVHAYGPTEASITILHHTCVNSTASYLPLGTAIAGSDVYLLDERLQPVPDLAVGEICIAGSTLARGYHARPRDTAASFLPNPFGAPGQRLYRSGDMAVRHRDGSLEFLGRRDRQLKRHGVRIELGEIESSLRSHPEIDQAHVLAEPAADGAGGVFAFVTAKRQQLSEEQVSGLRHWATQRLPPVMRPTQITVLEQLPTNANGKVDEAKLLQLALEHARSQVADRPTANAIEAVQRAFETALRRDALSLDSDFFEQGGDSISAIGVVNTLRAAGLQTSVAQIFQLRTVRRVAAASTTLRPTALAPQLTSARAPWLYQRFWQAAASPDHFNQTVLLHCSAGLSEEPLRRGLVSLVMKHAALRLRAVASDSGLHLEVSSAVERTDAPLTVLPARPNASDVLRAQQTLSCRRGPLLRALLWRESEEASAHLLLVAHHFAVDHVSWSILLADLEREYRSAAEGGPTTPLAPPDILRWANESATAETRPAQWGPWLATSRDDLYGDAGAETVELDVASTGAILARAAQAGYRVHELLIGAVAWAYGRNFAQPAPSIAWEHHGRGRADHTVEVNQLVGWLAAIHVATIPTSGADRAWDFADGTRALVRAAEAHQSWFESSAAAIVVNHLGSAPSDETRSFERIDPAELATSEIAADNPRPFPLVLTSHVQSKPSGGSALVLSLEFNVKRTGSSRARSILHGVTEALRALASSQPSLDSSITVTECYPLTPLQLGMLFRALRDPEDPAYVTQTLFRLSGALDEQRLRSAWAAALDTFPALRTRFVWEGMDDPLQMVCRAVELPWSTIPWPSGEEPAGEAADGIRALERARVGDLRRAPLTSLVLFRGSGDVHHLLWTQHHIVIDGWSISSILSVVAKHYRHPSAPIPSPSMMGFVRWLHESAKDEASAREFWRSELAGADSVSLSFLKGSTKAMRGGYGQVERSLSQPATAKLERALRRLGVTPGSAILAAWALTLARYDSSKRALLIAMVTSLRPPELSGVMTSVGLYMQTLPLLVPLAEMTTVPAFLSDIQHRVLRVQQHAGTPLNRIQRWSGFDASSLQSLVVIENYPDRETLMVLDDATQLEVLRADETTEYPMTLIAMPGPSLTFHLSYDQQALQAPLAAALSDTLLECVQSITEALEE